ncbi:uncharacterized protein MICPUCDRAFT_49329, partial [Micromonas pusilla CCMP1545]
RASAFLHHASHREPRGRAGEQQARAAPRRARRARALRTVGGSVVAAAARQARLRRVRRATRGSAGSREAVRGVRQGGRRDAAHGGVAVRRGVVPRDGEERFRGAARRRVGAGDGVARVTRINTEEGKGALRAR